MVEMFILVLGIYCMAAVMVHVYYSLSKIKEHSGKHYVLYTEKEVDILEWYYYNFRRFSKTMGVNVSITLVGEMLSSQSNEIIRRWQRHEDMIRCVKTYDKIDESDIHIYLEQPSDLKKLPF